jgi:hypothetical protein
MSVEKKDMTVREYEYLKKYNYNNNKKRLISNI